MNNTEKKTKHSGAHSAEVKPPRRKKGGWIVFLACLLIVALGIALLPRITAAQQETVRSIASAQAVPGTIQSALRSAGTLLDPDASYISIPDSVALEFVLENGDLVVPGDLIATVDTTSVMLSIAELQTAMDELDERIEDARDGDSTVTVTAPADGRIKAIYAESGDAVADVMYENSALLLLSLDGKMAVDISATGVRAGQTMQVELTDGTVMTGRVSTIAGSRATITVSDQGPTPGEAAAVRDEDGNLLGSGSLYIHSELKVTGYYGSVDSVSVSLEESVSAGETLLTLTYTDSSASYAGLLSQRQEMERQMQQLFQLYQDGGVYAGESGFIAEITETSGQTASQNQSQNQGMNMAGFMGIAWQGEQPQLRLLADVDIQPLTPVGISDALDGEAEVSPTPETEGDPEVTPDTEDSPTPGTENAPEVSPDTEVSPTPETEGDPEVTPDPEVSPTPAGSSDPEDEDDTSFAYFADVYAKVSAVTDGGLELRIADSDSPVHYADIAALSSLDYTRQSTLTPAETITVLVYNTGLWELGEVSDIQAGDHLVLTYVGSENGALLWIVRHPGSSSAPGKSDGKPETSPTPTPTTESDSSASDEMSSSSSSSNSSKSGMTTGTGTSMTAGAMTGIAGAAQEQSYTLTETQICAITPDNSMTVELSIDELDILALSEGQDVILHLDALNKNFTGTITEIAAEATSNGGSPKFLVTVELLRDLDMRTGMNAAATIVLSETEAACTLPAEAVMEQNGQCFVYTGYDEKHDELTDPVEVTTGLSDGLLVEVFGLNNGTIVYYEYQDTLISPLF